MDTVTFSVGFVFGMITATVLILASIMLVEFVFKYKAEQDRQAYLRNGQVPPQYPTIPTNEYEMTPAVPPKPSRTMHDKKGTS